MPFADADGVKLYYEEAGSGTPIVFVHEFATDAPGGRETRPFGRSCEPTGRVARHFRCASIAARHAPCRMNSQDRPMGTIR